MTSSAEPEQREPGPEPAERLEGVFLGAGLHRHRGRRARRIPGGDPAARDRRAEPEQEKEQHGHGRELHLRPGAREEPAAEVAAEDAQRQGGDRRSEREAECAADDAEQGCFDDEEPLQLARGHAGHPQVGQLRAAGDRRLGLQREYEEAAGEQRHQRQHVQIDPVRARQVGHSRRFGVGAGDGHARRQVQGVRQSVDRGAGRELEVDARQLADTVEPPLRVAEIHHADQLARARTRQRADDGKVHFARAGEHAHRPAGLHVEAKLGRGRQEQAVADDREARRVVGGHRHQRPRQCRCAEDVQADDRQQRRAGLRRAEHGNLEFEHRAREFDGRIGDDALEQRLVESLARARDRSIGLAGHRADGRREFAQRRLVDEVHRVAQRHPDRDGEDLHDRAQPVLPRIAGEDVPGEPPHAGSLGPPLQADAPEEHVLRGFAGGGVPKGDQHQYGHQRAEAAGRSRRPPASTRGKAGRSPRWRR